MENVTTVVIDIILHFAEHCPQTNDIKRQRMHLKLLQNYHRKNCAAVLFSTKFPILLPRKHHFTTLVIVRYQIPIKIVVFGHICKCLIFKYLYSKLYVLYISILAFFIGHHEHIKSGDIQGVLFKSFLRDALSNRLDYHLPLLFSEKCVVSTDQLYCSL